MIQIENQNSFEHALCNGVNLFVGAGFSVLAKDKLGRYLPVGQKLRDELAAHFNKPQRYELPVLCTIINSTEEQNLTKYLTNRFTVGIVDPLYFNLRNVKFKGIYTTNIDNLIYEVYKDVSGVFINNLETDGKTTDENGIDYLGLHGSVVSQSPKYIFDVGSLATIFNNAPRIWHMLAQSLEQYPTIFVGYGFGDNSVMQTLLSQQTFAGIRKDMWVVLRKEDQEFVDYYRSLGFHIIKSDVKGLLEFLGTIKGKGRSSSYDNDKYFYLRNYLVPHNLSEVKIQRPIKDFFEGGTPMWCDILSGQICKTHYLSSIMNSIYEEGKNTVIIGAPVTGKTTLLMQAAKVCEGMGVKLYFESITQNRAEYIAKMIGDDKAVIFIDNLYDSVEAIQIFEKHSNIKLVCCERSHYFGIISNLIDEEKYNVYNVSSLTDADFQNIFRSVPESLRKGITYQKKIDDIEEKDTLFEFVCKHVTSQNVKERYTRALKELESQDKELAEFLILCAYMHSCHVPLSFEVAYDYFDSFDVDSIFSLREDASDIIKDYIPKDGDYADMDYYYPRSRYIAEVIIEASSRQLLANVLNGVLERVSYMHICDYRIFRRHAFDKNIVLRAFKKWSEGKRFYETAFLYDNKNPYVLQQGALYLSQKEKYEEAFVWIDRAISMTDDKYFSIRNSHAIILFNANIEKMGGDVRGQLDRSMSILERCMNADSRKRFHALVYTDQAIRYFEKFHDEKARGYLITAHGWLQQVIRKRYWEDDCRTILRRLKLVMAENGLAT